MRPIICISVLALAGTPISILSSKQVLKFSKPDFQYLKILSVLWTKNFRNLYMFYDHFFNEKVR